MHNYVISHNTAAGSSNKDLFLTPRNLGYYAQMMDNTISVSNGRLIHVAAGTPDGRFLTVPLTQFGEQLNNDTIIRVTVGIKPKNVDSDPKIGITDGHAINEIAIPDSTHHIPCVLAGGSNHALPANIPPPSEVTMNFQPYHRYGSCSTAQNGGYINVGIFPTQLNITKGLSLVARRDNERGEVYDFYYFRVQFIN